MQVSQATPTPKTGGGLKIKRLFTKNHPGDPYFGIEFEKRISLLEKPDGTVISRIENVEVPTFWSQVATDVLAQKYLRKTGVPQRDGSLGPETSAKQVVNRLAETWCWWANKHGYFSNQDDFDAFEDEIKFMLMHQMAAPNSPQFFNTGLAYKYGITGESQGHWYVDTDSGELRQSEDAYTRPAVHACFLQSIRDDLVNEGGIFDLVTKEARVFKFGGGSGTNYSALRGKGEPLTGGGTSSGVMSFLKVFDAAAGSIKSGGVTRRAAKMDILDIDHPEIEDFITWKSREEQKVAALVTAGYADDYEGEAYQTVSGQNANNSVRVTDEFMRAVQNDDVWHLRNRTDGEVYKTVRTRDLWNMIAEASWQSADPGLQFHDTINYWNTCRNDGEITTTNPCGEYHHITNTACNLASLNLVRFINPDGTDFDHKAFAHATRLWTIVLDISVTMAQLPSKEIAQGTYDYRTLGLGYANLGSLLMRFGYPYDSKEGRDLAANITSLMTGTAYKTSAELAGALGSFPRFEQNRSPMLRVMAQHRGANEQLTLGGMWLDAQEAWDRVIEMGEIYGFRNAQTTLLAPTGTIALLMDCDTTGVEPDFSLTKYKKLAGGGTWKIVNQSVAPALYNLGYTHAEIEDIMGWVEENETVEVPNHLKAVMHRVLDEHLPVFDCANRCGNGERYIQPYGHIHMMAAVQPFLSGAISKTINVPSEATVDDIVSVHWSSWELGLKAIALYRDGSKLSQPLSSKDSDKKSEVTKERIPDPTLITSNGNRPAEVEPQRRKMPAKRYGITQELEIAGHKLYLRTGEYEDGKLGEIFVDLHKEGAALRSIMNCFAIAVSKGLQYGVPLEEFVESFTHQRFEPQGIVRGHDNIKMATSIIDVIFRVLALEYLGKTDYAQVPPTEKPVNVTQLVLSANGNGAQTESSIPVHVQTETHSVDTGGPQMGLMSHQSHSFSSDSDAPFCDECGHLMLRSGSCYRCLNCGGSSGCS